MKIVKILTIGLLTALALGTSVNASVKIVDAPLAVISQVSSEVVNPSFANTKFNLVFVVNEKGEVTNITSESKISSELIKAVSTAVKHWKFSPAYRNGVAVSTKVILPVVIEG
jgi:hypothetical protein